MHAGLEVLIEVYNSSVLMEQHTFKNVNCCWNTKITFYLETSGGQNNNNLYLKVVHFFNTSVNQTSVAAQDSVFSALVSVMHCSIVDNPQGILCQQPRPYLIH